MERIFTVKKDFGVLLKGDEISIYTDIDNNMIFIATNRKNKKREYIKNTIFQGQIVKKGGFILVDVPAGNIEVMRFETPRPQPHPTEMFSVDGLLCEEWHEKIINDFIEIGVF